jgi:hypothetical protein
MVQLAWCVVRKSGACTSRATFELMPSAPTTSELRTSCVVPCLRRPATCRTQSSAWALASDSEEKRRPARKLRLRYCTPRSTFPLCSGVRATHGQMMKP